MRGEFVNTLLRRWLVTGFAGLALVVLFLHPAGAQSLPAAPAEWSYSAIPTVSATGYPEFSGLPSIVIPAVSGTKHVSIACPSL